MIKTTTIVGSGPAVVRKLILSEDGAFTIHPDMVVLHSEVVVDNNNTEVLEVWVALPSQAQQPPHTAQETQIPQSRTIYNQTTVHNSQPSMLQSEEAEEEEGNDVEFYY